MAYETGVSTSIADLLDKIRIFALARGYTTNEFAPWSTASGSGDRLFMQKTTSNGGAFNLSFGLESVITPVATPTKWELHVRGNTGFTALADIENQPGHAGTTAILDRLGPGPYVAYHLFSDAVGDYIHLVLEYSAGFFKHLALGQLVKYGTYDGGHYFDTSFDGTITASLDNAVTSSRSMLFAPGSPSFSVDNGHVSVNSESNVWRKMSPATGTITTWDAYFNGLLAFTDTLSQFSQPNTFNLATPLLPIYGFTDKGGQASVDKSPIGYVPDIRSINIEFLAVGAEVVLGPDTWKVFPHSRKSSQIDTGDNLPNSWNLGLAYKKIV